MNLAVHDAATVLLIRPAAPFEIFMVRRTSKAAFMPDAMVFPGGRLDASDQDDATALRCDLSRQDAAHRLGMNDGVRALGLLVAGVRETFEEAGVLLAHTEDGAPFNPATAKAAFEAHTEAYERGILSFADLLESLGLTLTLSTLTFCARWVTPPRESRRFDAYFLLTTMPSKQRARHDGRETTASAWLSPKAVLADYADGHLQLVPPTIRLLEALAGLPNFEAALNWRRDVIPVPIEPQIKVEGDVVLALLPGDRDYTPPGHGRDRMVMEGGRWRSEGAGC